MRNTSLRPESLRIGGKAIHYAWAMVTIAAIMRLSTSAFRSSQSILIPRLVESFGWSYGGVGGAFALQWVVSGLFGPPSGWLGDRYGVRVTMLIGAILFIAGMALTSTMTHLWQFYLFFGVLLSASMGIFQVPLTAAVTLWFRKHLGVGMGILQSSQGLGPLVAAPIILLVVGFFDQSETGGRIVSNIPLIGGEFSGLRAAFWIPGLVGGVILLLLIRWFYNEPADVGLRPLGAPRDEPVRSVQKGSLAQARTKAFLRRAQRTSTFWNLIGIHYWGCAGHAIILVYLVAIAESRGVSTTLAAGTFIVLTGTSSITRFAVPILADRFGSKGVMGICFFLQVAPVLILFVATDAWMFYLFAFLFGIGFGGEMTAFPIINRQYYGSAPIGTAYGWQMMGAGLGMAWGAWLGGQLRDITGDFTATMALSLGLSMLGVISVAFLPKTSKLQIPDWEEAISSNLNPKRNEPAHSGD